MIVTISLLLQVPSVSFASSHLLSLLAVGRIAGLVLDCGFLESVALPVRVVDLNPKAVLNFLCRYLLLDRYSHNFVLL